MEPPDGARSLLNLAMDRYAEGDDGAFGHGAACGAWANVLLLLWCSLSDAPHVVLGHVAPLVLFIVAGGLVGPYTLGGRGRVRHFACFCTTCTKVTTENGLVR
jgi:hypothetical protein